ncbi:mechanosensitive ion channel, partial [Candidatus Woesearchaeota archaeon]|nr:mechanosensitive ion channel [Candidatus Woesearchaeota archaeon]
VQSYTNLVIMAVVILIVGLTLGLLAKKLLYRLLKEVELNKIATKGGIGWDVEHLISSIISYLIYFATTVIFLSYLGIGKWVIYLVLGGIVILLALTVLVGIKDAPANFMGWVAAKRKNKLKKGRNIEVNGMSGIVEKTGLLKTIIRTERGDLLYVPNALFRK